MAIFNQQSTAKKEAASFTPDPPPFRETPANANADASPAAAAPRPVAEAKGKESLVAANLTIEGKIEGAGDVRIAGRFTGDVNVQGNLTIEVGAKVSGGVRAQRVVIAGELEGNVDAASRVELLETGVVNGDIKAGSLTVAAGSRMHGRVEFGDDSKPASKVAKMENGSALS